MSSARGDSNLPGPVAWWYLADCWASTNVFLLQVSVVSAGRKTPWAEPLRTYRRSGGRPALTCGSRDRGRGCPLDLKQEFVESVLVERETGLKGGGWMGTSFSMANIPVSRTWPTNSPSSIFFGWDRFSGRGGQSFAWRAGRDHRLAQLRLNPPPFCPRNTAGVGLKLRNHLPSLCVSFASDRPPARASLGMAGTTHLVGRTSASTTNRNTASPPCITQVECLLPTGSDLARPQE